MDTLDQKEKTNRNELPSRPTQAAALAVLKQGWLNWLRNSDTAETETMTAKFKTPARVKSRQKKYVVSAEAKPLRKKTAPRSAFKPGNPHVFKPGQSGNPGGRPKGSESRLISKALLAYLGDRAPNEVATACGLPFGASWAQCMAKRLITLALRGDVSAMREVREATEGNRIRADLNFPDPADAPKLVEIVFLESDGAGRPALPIIEAQSSAAPALPAETS
jgi:hypothetical protein